ncbi:Maf family protein [Pseudomonas sp. Marseille-QA0892]
MKNLILASSSPYRRELLQRLHIPFQHASPEVDEERLPHEPGRDMVARLAEQKAKALADRFPNHLIIGSDQAAILGDEVLGKPHTHARAAEQLRAASGQSVRFETGLALLNTSTGRIQRDTITFTVHFRELDETIIDRYLRAESPLDCAGSFKAEGLGIALFSSMEGSDMTSLIGLPLIRLVDMLLEEGVQVP